MIYDKSIEGFFEFFRFIVGLSFLTFLIFGTMLGYYMYLLWDDIITDMSLCSTYIPCFTLFSRFPDGYELYYLCTIIGFILVGFFCIIYKWLTFDQKMRWEEVSGENKQFAVSKLFFNSWDWSIDTSHEMQELRKVVARETKLTIDEERIRLRVKNRKAAEKAKLLGIRIGTFIVSFFILCIGWSAIVAVNLYESDIEDFFSEIDILDYVVNHYHVNYSFI